MSENNELVVVKPVDVPALFEDGGCDSLLKRIKKEVFTFVPDLSTAGGRKEIASLAYRVAQSKTYLDGLGKDLGADLAKKVAVINGERKKVRDELDAIKDDVRKPLTEWEDAEKKRVADIEERIEAIKESVNAYPYNDYDFDNSAQVSERLKNIKAIVIDDSFEEFAVAAAKIKDQVVTHLEAKFIVMQNAEKEKAEAERLKKERLEKEQKEREEKIATEAAEKVKETEDRLKAEEEEEADKLAKKAENKAHRGKINRAAKSALI